MQGIYSVDHAFNFCLQFLPDCKLLKMVLQNIQVNVMSLTLHFKVILCYFQILLTCQNAQT
jgi:hypothetical protein